jgi:mRNA-degrading endonuclease RelE of RelBE toxin-antitoxin system
MTERAVTEVSALPAPVKARVKAAILSLSQDPTGLKGALEVKRLEAGSQSMTLYRLRVGDWRIVYHLRPDRVEVVRVFHRRDGYGWMERMG